MITLPVDCGAPWTVQLRPTNEDGVYLVSAFPENQPVLVFGRWDDFVNRVVVAQGHKYATDYVLERINDAIFRALHPDKVWQMPETEEP